MLLTAKGKMDVDTKASIDCAPLDKILDRLVLDSDCPSVLILGRLCDKAGYLFVWEPWYGQPVLFKENGDMILLYGEHLVPLIDDNTVPQDVSKMVANIIQRLRLCFSSGRCCSKQVIPNTGSNRQRE